MGDGRKGASDRAPGTRFGGAALVACGIVVLATTVGWERSRKKLGRNDFSLDSVLEVLWKKGEHDPVVRLSARWRNDRRVVLIVETFKDH